MLGRLLQGGYGLRLVFWRFAVATGVPVSLVSGVLLLGLDQVYELRPELASWRLLTVLGAWFAAGLAFKTVAAAGVLKSAAFYRGRSLWSGVAVSVATLLMLVDALVLAIFVAMAAAR